jgi:preprotein translocase subunit SecA
MDYLRHSVNLRGYAQKNPSQEYKRESFILFEALLDTINVEIVKALSSVSINPETNANEIEQQNNDEMQAQHQGVMAENASADADDNNTQTFQRSNKKIGRNDPCPCGSEKKYKNCHG